MNREAHSQPEDRVDRARKLALRTGHRAKSALRRLQQALEDAHASDQQAPMSVLMTIFRLFSRFRRDREIADLIRTAQAELAALDAAVDVLRAAGMILSAERVSTRKYSEAPTRGRGSRWLGALSLARGTAHRVDALLDELRKR